MLPRSKRRVVLFQPGSMRLGEKVRGYPIEGVDVAPQVAFYRAIAWGLIVRMELFIGGARVQDDWRD